MIRKKILSASLFSGAGIGDNGFRAAGYSFLVMSEVEYDRAQLAKVNFPEAEIFVGDINNNIQTITQHTVQGCKNNETELFLLSCTAPCQGMSKSGQGTLLKNIRRGKRPKLDPRNRLILPALKIIRQVRPLFIVFENVCEMKNTIIEDEHENNRLILDIIRDSLGEDYEGEAYDIEMADYGVPQRRKRLITIFTRDKNAINHYKNGVDLIPAPTHSRHKLNGRKPWISLKEALSGFPLLDAKSKETSSDPNIAFHRVPQLDPKKYEWIRHTPVGATAFDNQCVEPACGFQFNKTHGASKNREGINQAHKSTPLYCEKCGQLLPRPYVKNKNGSLRIMSGYTSAYKRMEPDLPCSALTRNLSFPCSDNKIHPFENRVLSLAEAFVINTLNDYEYIWGPIKDRKGKIRDIATDTLVRLVIGESIPPRFTEKLGNHLIRLSKKSSAFKLKEKQYELLYG